MQKVILNYPINVKQHFFIQKGIELLFRNTIDSYRLRLNNPKTLLKELIDVCKGVSDGILTSNDYSNKVSKELLNFLNVEGHGLTFDTINKTHFIKTISNKKPNHLLIIQSCKLLLRDNENYLSNLFQDLLLINTSNEVSEDDFNKISLILNNLFVELINIGYSKNYLYNFFYTVFVRRRNDNKNFLERLDIFKTLFEKDDELFKVIYLIQGSRFNVNELKRIDSGYKLVDRRFRAINRQNVSDEVIKFMDIHKEEKLLLMEQKAKDYYRATELATEKLSKDLDIYHLGYPNHIIEIGKSCCVIGAQNPSKSSKLPSKYIIDGYFRSNTEVFQLLLSKLRKVKSNNIEKDSFDKLMNAIRYYRTGSESSELETKFLNYWIGLEYIFTSFKMDNRTIDRITHYFTVCHSLIYIKRNMFDFHKAIERLELNNGISNYDDSLEYLLNESFYDNAFEGENNELLKYRASELKKWLVHPNNIQKSLNNHKLNLESNLIRLYRIRNEIVHNAAIKNGIYTNISHIKYYLSFIINSILDFMATNPLDINDDGVISIEDYFITQEVIYGSLTDKPLRSYLQIENPTQIFY